MKPIKIKATKEIIKKVPEVKRKTVLADVRHIKDDEMCLSFFASVTGYLYRLEPYLTKRAKDDVSFAKRLKGVLDAIEIFEPLHADFLIEQRTKERLQNE